MTTHPPCTGCDDPTCRSEWKTPTLLTSTVTPEDALRRLIGRAERAEVQLLAAKAALGSETGWVPFSLRDAIERGDIEACRQRALRADRFVEGLQKQADEYRARVTELESKLAACAASCEAEAGRAREAALEEAAKCAEATGEELERLGANNGYGNTYAADIRALKAGGR